MIISTTKPDEINKAHGQAVDNEGWLNNSAIKPKMYEEDGYSLSKLTERVNVVDIFDSEEEAKSTVLGMEKKVCDQQIFRLLQRLYKAT